MAFARSFVALVALLCFAVVAVVRAQAASGDVTKLQIGVKVRAGGGGGGWEPVVHGTLRFCRAPGFLINRPSEWNNTLFSLSSLLFIYLNSTCRVNGSSESGNSKLNDQNQDRRSARKRTEAVRNVLSLSLPLFPPFFSRRSPRTSSKPPKPKPKKKNSPAPQTALSSPSRATRSPFTTRGRSRTAPSLTRRSTGEEKKREREREREGKKGR